MIFSMQSQRGPSNRRGAGRARSAPYCACDGAPLLSDQRPPPAKRSHSHSHQGVGFCGGGCSVPSTLNTPEAAALVVASTTGCVSSVRPRAVACENAPTETNEEREKDDTGLTRVHGFSPSNE